MGLSKFNDFFSSPIEDLKKFLENKEVLYKLIENEETTWVIINNMKNI